VAAPAEAPEEDAGAALDWRFARPGDAVRVRGGGAAVLVALPDRRGLAAVSVGGARLLVPADRVRPAAGDERPALRPRPRVRVEAAAQPEDVGLGGSDRCDLHGMRVDEALERLLQALDRAARRGCDRLVIVHGRGTGALRDAVRRFLSDSPYATSFGPADASEGGDGATVVNLA
jgi:DNA mismatch repair protein MutS2